MKPKNWFHCDDDDDVEDDDDAKKECEKLQNASLIISVNAWGIK